MAIDCLPSHTSPSGQTVADVKNPQQYTLPTQFVIGVSITKPLVSIQGILGHLTLLHAFAELKNAVDAVATPTIQGVSLTKEQRWSWFIGCAVERFDIWCHALHSTDASVDTEIIMPPLDVIMVWHAYLLNPSCFVKDSKRWPACGNLRLLERQFTECLNGKFNVLLHQPPSQSRVEFWRSKTLQPFGYSVNGVDAIEQKSVACHYCRNVVSVDLINPSGTGYLQESFSFDCPNSHIFNTITKETLAVRKLAIDLAGTGLSGSTFPEVDKIINGIKAAASAAKHGDLQEYAVGSPEYVVELSMAIAQSAQFSMDTLRNQMGTSNRPQLDNRITTAYFNEQVYSIELVAAVLRQESFLRKMYDLGWTRSGYFNAEIDALALHHASARYHAFLDLMTLQSSCVVPTLDIDLVWHTHQLMAGKYQQDCQRYVGRFIDHDDKIEGPRLSSGFDDTCRAWESRFNVNYAYCGCPIPGDSIGSRLSLLVKMYNAPPPTKGYDGLTKVKGNKAEKVANQTLKSEAHACNGRPDEGIISPPYSYGAFLVAVPMYTSGKTGVGSCDNQPKSCGGGCASSCKSSSCSSSSCSGCGGCGGG